MHNPPYELSANLSLLFTEHPVLDRFAAAAAAGFDAVELWWPFAEAVPSDAEIDDLVSAATTSGVRLTGLNFFAGDMPAGERGVLSLPERTAEFRDNVALVVEIAERTGCRHFNALYGARRAGLSSETQDETALANLVYATEAVAGLGGTVLVEPVSGVAGFPLVTAADAVRVIEQIRDRVGSGSAALLFDTFHQTNNGDDPVDVAAAFGSMIGHVQFADAPGRAQPGTGGVDFVATLAALEAAHYRGLVALEYAPQGPSAQSFDWIASLPRLRPLATR